MITKEEWSIKCVEFDKSIQDLMNRNDLTDEQKEIRQSKMLDKFNDEMNELKKAP